MWKVTFAVSWQCFQVFPVLRHLAKKQSNLVQLLLQRSVMSCKGTVLANHTSDKQAWSLNWTQRLLFHCHWYMKQHTPTNAGPWTVLALSKCLPEMWRKVNCDWQLPQASGVIRRGTWLISKFAYFSLWHIFPGNYVFLCLYNMFWNILSQFLLKRNSKDSVTSKMYEHVSLSFFGCPYS